MDQFPDFFSSERENLLFSAVWTSMS